MSRKILLLMILLVLVPLMTVSLGSEVEFDVPNWAVEVAPFEPIPLYAVVEVDALNIRDAPSTNGEKIGMLHKGDRVEILAWAVGYNSYDNPDYIWAEVSFGEQRGFVAAEEAEYGFGGYDKERYLTVEHDFGVAEMSLIADVDGDGIKENIHIETGDVHVNYEPFYYYEMVYIYRLPLLLKIEDVGEYQLADFVMGISYDELSIEEFVATRENKNFHDYLYSWSLYDLRAEDIDGDGVDELQLTLDLRSSFPTPGMLPTFDYKRTLWFSLQNDQLRKIYGYTEYAFVPEIEDGYSGSWTEIRGEAKLSPDRLLYRALITCSVEDELDYHNFRTIRVHDRLTPLDLVHHELPPPNYLNEGLHCTTELEAHWVDSAGIYALYCPSGNDYARSKYWFFGNPAHPARLLHGDRNEYGFYNDYSFSGKLAKPLPLLCLPEEGTAEAGVLAAKTIVKGMIISTRDGNWYLVYPNDWDVFYEDATPLMGWTKVLPEFVE